MSRDGCAGAICRRGIERRTLLLDELLLWRRGRRATGTTGGPGQEHHEALGADGDIVDGEHWCLVSPCRCVAPLRQGRQSHAHGAHCMLLLKDSEQVEEEEEEHEEELLLRTACDLLLWNVDERLLRNFDKRKLFDTREEDDKPMRCSRLPGTKELEDDEQEDEWARRGLRSVDDDELLLLVVLVVLEEEEDDDDDEDEHCRRRRRLPRPRCSGGAVRFRCWDLRRRRFSCGRSVRDRLFLFLFLAPRPGLSLSGRRLRPFLLPLCGGSARSRRRRTLCCGLRRGMQHVLCFCC